MKLKTETNPYGAGRGKSQKRLSLERANLILLIQTRSVKQISILFNISIHMVNIELTRQLQEKKIGFTVLEPEEEVDISEGSWMKSPERKALIEYRLNK